ncbi:carbohydrate ABC transporter permease [Dactylosporangium sucinum]|uniref:carbohydrate ABC transporter permease n=1 Tax=Dactylosporangium sucinum TaxID=1424081 RepID=UPI00167D401D|nr:sugar ABC transporter permease [Dactylosporangium sucinum]
MPASARRRRRNRRPAAPYVLAAPFAVLFAAFYLAPIGYAVWASLHKRVQTGGFGFSAPSVNFVWFDNYAQVLADPSFGRGIVRTLLFGIVQVPVMLVIALALALILDSGLAWLGRTFRIVYFLPYAVPGVIAAILWGFLYSPAVSPISDVLSHTPLGRVNFLSSDATLWSIANIVTWSWTGYNMLIIFAALQAVPRDILEAARTDGATEFAIALRIKVPMLVPALVLTGVFSIIGTLQLFTEPSVLAKLTGSVDSAYTPNLMAYTAAFVSNNIYYSAAISVCIALITFVLSFVLLRATWRRALEA